jgi:hypothetical protein
VSKPKSVEIIPVGDPRRPSWIPERNERGYPLNVYIDEGCWREERWGQYVLPKFDPEQENGHDGRGRTWQRATTFIKMAEYAGEGLSDYQIRHAMAGLIRRPDLLVRAARLWDLPDKHRMTKDEQAELKAEWKEIAEEAHEASGGNEASRNGTEIHAAIEWVNRGGTVETLPTALVIDGVEADLTVWSRHVEAYLDLRDSEDGFEVFPELCERVVNPDEDGTSGKFDVLARYLAPKKLIDNLNTMRPKGDQLEYWTEPRFVVVDVKGGDTEYRESFSRQLKRYAVADAVWDFERDCYEDMPEDVCQDFGLVVRVPWWEADPKVELIPIPFGPVAEEGLEACRIVKKARSLRLPKMKSLALGYASEVEEAPRPDPVKANKFRRRPSGAMDQSEPSRAESATVERVDRMAIAAGRNDDEDEPAAVGKAIAAGILDGEGKPLGELAVGSERGCSVCRRKGHRKGSAKCLGANDPDTGDNGAAAADQPTDEADWCRRSGRCADAGWTSPDLVEGGDPDGPWICGECGKPSRAGQIDGSGEPVEVSKDRVRDRAAEEKFIEENLPDEEAVFGDNEMTDEEYWLQLLVAAQSRAAVSQIGQSAKAALGKLTPALQEAGRRGLAKYPRVA